MLDKYKTGSTIANGRKLSLVAVNEYKTAIDGLNLSQAQVALSTTALNETQKEQILTEAGLITSTDSATAAEVKQAVSENVLTTAKQQEILAVFEQQMAEGQLSIERLQAIALENTEAGAVARVILAKKGENAQNLKNIASGKALNAVLKEQFLLLLKNPLTWVAVAVVGVVALTKAIENSIVTEEKLNEEIEELNSNWSELSSTIQNSTQSFQSLKKSADELIPRYAELAQGVDKYGNNVSLTDEEFEEFVSLNNQLGQMFPELVMGYDSNGNAILSLSGNVNTLTESLYSLVEAQRLASAQTIADTMPDVMSNIDSTVEAYKSQIELAENSMSDLDDLYNIFSNEGYVEAWSSVGESMIDAVKILDKYGIKYNSEITGERNGVVGSTKYKITVDWDDFETSYNGVIAGYEKKINDIENKIESKWKQLNPVVSAWLSTDYLYQDLESNGQSLVTAMVGAIDFKSLGLTTEQEVQNYISNSIISPIYDMDTATQNAFFKIFDLHEALDNGELSVQEYQKEINNILENGNYSQEFVTIFRMAFAEDDVQTKYNATLDRFKDEETQSLDELKTKYQEAIDKRKELYSGEYYIGNVDINNRPVVINDDGSYSTTSTSFQEKWIGDEETGSYKIIHYTPILPDGTILEDDALNEYIDKILNSSDSLKADSPANGGYGIVYKIDTEVNGQKITDDNLDIAFGIADAWDVEMHEKQDKMYRDEAKLKAAIERFGSDSSSNLKKFFTDNSINTEEEIDYFNKVTEGAKTASEAIEMYRKAKFSLGDPPSFTTTLSSVQNLSKGLDQLDSIMADVINGENFDWSSIFNNDSFKEAFEDCGEAYDDFIKTISESPNDLSKCQSAFDDLATEYIYHSGALENLTEDTKEATTTMLKEMGIGNAEEVINSMLQGYTEAMQLANAASIDFANATAEEIYSLTGLEAEFENAGVSAFNYYLKKKLCSKSSISTVADCNALIALAEQCQVTGKNIEILTKLRNLYNVVESEMWGDATKELAEKEISKLKSELMDTATVALPKFTGGTKSTAEAQNKLKDSTEKATEALEKQKEALEEELSELDELYDAINWFYDKKIEKIEDTIDAINNEIDALEKQKDNLDDIIEAIERNYDAEISKIQEKVDALNDENDEQERAIALEEAKRKLQEAKSRKTVQVYTKNAGFVYQVDTKAIKEAEDELEELQKNEVVAELEKQIDKLEEAKEKWSEIPDAYNQAMQDIAASNYFGYDWKNLTLFPSDELLNNFKGTYTGIQGSIDSKNTEIDTLEKEKERIEELKSLWEDAKNFYQEKQYEMKLEAFFGSDYEYQLLQNSAEWRQQFADKYASISSQVAELEEKIKVASDKTTESVEKIGGTADESAGKVRNLGKELEELDGKNVTTTVTTRVVTVGSGSGMTLNTNKVFASAKAKGGIITKEDGGDLDFVAKKLGEDHMIAIQEGEAVIPKESVSKNPELVNQLVNDDKSEKKANDRFQKVIIDGVEREVEFVTLESMYGWGDANDGIHPKEFDFEAFSRKYGDFQEDPLLSPKNFERKDQPVQNVTKNTNNSVTELHFNGDLSFPNIRSSVDAEKLIHELSTLSSKALQRANRRI